MAITTILRDTFAGTAGSKLIDHTSDSGATYAADGQNGFGGPGLSQKLTGDGWIYCDIASALVTGFQVGTGTDYPIFARWKVRVASLVQGSVAGAVIHGGQFDFGLCCEVSYNGTTARVDLIKREGGYPIPFIGQALPDLATGEHEFGLTEWAPGLYTVTGPMSDGTTGPLVSFYTQTPVTGGGVGIRCSGVEGVTGPTAGFLIGDLKITSGLTEEGSGGGSGGGASIEDINATLTTKFAALQSTLLGATYAANVTQIAGNATAASNLKDDELASGLADDQLDAIGTRAASKVWGTSSRTLSAFGFSVSVADKTGFALAGNGLDQVQVDGVNARQALAICYAGAAGVVLGPGAETGTGPFTVTVGGAQRLSGTMAADARTAVDVHPPA